MLVIFAKYKRIFSNAKIIIILKQNCQNDNNIEVFEYIKF